MTKESKIQTRVGRLNKPNEILVMVPRTGRLTLVGRKLYNVLLHHSQLKLQSLRGRTLEATEYFEAPLRQLLDPVGTGESDYRALAKKYLVEMQDVTMEWDSPEATAGTEWKRLKLLSEVDFVRKSGEVWVRWALPPTLVQGIADPQRWTSLELSVMARLTTYAAVALYEICARYKNNPSGVTGRKPTDWWIDALSNSPPPLDAQGVKKRREWRKIKNEFVIAAVEQINEHTDLEVELLEYKQGRAVSEVQFAVRKKIARVELVDPALPVNTSLLQRAERAGLTGQEFEALSATYGDKELAESLTKLEQRKAMSGLEEVRSAAGYLRHLLGKREQPATERATAGDGEEGRAPSPVEAPRDGAVDWIQTRREEIAGAITQLSTDKQRKLLSQVIESLRERGLLTPSVSRRASQGDWYATGFLRNEMVQLYAQLHLGPDWDRPPEVIDGQMSLVASEPAEEGTT